MKTKETLIIASRAVEKRFAKAAGAVRMTAGFVVLAGMLGMIGCSQTGDITKLRGSIADGEDFKEVNIIIEKFGIDTLVPVVNGKFSIDLPTDPTEVAFVVAGYYSGYFIPDGTRLAMELGEETTVVSKSKSSLQNRFNAFEDGVSECEAEFQEAYSDLEENGDPESEDYGIRFDEIFNALASSLVGYMEQAVLDNRDNAIGGVAVSRLDGWVEDESLLVLIGTLSDEVQESTIVAPLQQTIAIRLLTAEGQPFMDFSAEAPDGSTVNLSDYVGNGKYVLVDFWASWCEPCKAEIPYIKAAYEKFRRKGFDVVSVAVADEPQDSKDTAKELGMNWNLMINAGQLPAELYGFSTIPQIMLFGPDGTILKKGLRGEEISEEIGKYIK